MGFIPTRVHGAIDYIFAVLLIAAPWLFGFADESAATIVPVMLGVGIAFYSLITAYEWGLTPAINMSTHLFLDFIGGVLLAASPWLFGFADHVWIPHLVFGLLEIGTVMSSQRTPAYLPGANRYSGRSVS